MSMFRFKGLGDGILLGAGVPGAGSRTRRFASFESAGT